MMNYTNTKLFIIARVLNMNIIYVSNSKNKIRYI